MSYENFDLPGYLAACFPTLSWPRITMSAVFYNWPVALRFDLCGHRDNLATVYARAIALYEAAFSAEDICVIASSHVVFPSGSAVPRYNLFSFAAEHGLRLSGAPQRDEVEIIAADLDDSRVQVLEWICRPARLFGHELVVKGIANRDHKMRPWIDDKVYFLAPEKGLLFHMYDDRGLDIVAENRNNLIPLYRRFNHWILEYDRVRMRQTFDE